MTAPAGCQHSAFVLIHLQPFPCMSSFAQLRVVRCFPFTISLTLPLCCHPVPLAVRLVDCSISSVHFWNYILTFIFYSIYTTCHFTCMRAIAVKYNSTSSLSGALLYQCTPFTRKKSRDVVNFEFPKHSFLLFYRFSFVCALMCHCIRSRITNTHKYTVKYCCDLLKFDLLHVRNPIRFCILNRIRIVFSFSFSFLIPILYVTHTYRDRRACTLLALD